MKHIIATIVVGLSTHTYYAHQNDLLIDQDLIAYQSQNDQTASNDSHLDQPIPPLSPSTPFENFIHLFMTLLNPTHTNNNLKVVEDMIKNLINAAFQLIKLNSSDPDITQDHLRNKITDINPFINRFLNELLHQRSHAFRFTAKRPQNTSTQTTNKPDETTQKVLSSFALIVQNFFNIVQDPENADNVAPNIMEMLAGIVTIGTEVITKGLSLDADNTTIDTFVTIIDLSMKEDCYRIIREGIANNTQA
jgi:hypothetical protein